MEPERDCVVFTAGREVAQAAIAQAASCEACNRDAADWPFEAILDSVMLFSGVHTDYVMPEPPAWPAMQSGPARLGGVAPSAEGICSMRFPTGSPPD